MNKEIVYLEKATFESKYPNTDNAYPDDVKIGKTPTKCKVTINGTFVIEDVYASHPKPDHPISLYKDYKLKTHGFSSCYGNTYWTYLEPIGLVLEFKSENYIIEPL